MTDDAAVTLVPSRSAEWEGRFAEAAAWLARRVPEARIEHIGSTSVPGLPAKDVVDVLVGVDAGAVVPVARRLAEAGLDLEGERDAHCWLTWPDRRRRSGVVHVVELGGRAWENRVLFRDLLRRDDGARRQYLAVKEAAARDAHGWDDYTQAKTEVVRALLERARAEVAGPTSGDARGRRTSA